MAGRGRGRGMVLPAWKTNPKGVGLGLDSTTSLTSAPEDTTQQNSHPTNGADKQTDNATSSNGSYSQSMYPPPQQTQQMPRYNNPAPVGLPPPMNPAQQQPPLLQPAPLQPITGVPRASLPPLMQPISAMPSQAPVAPPRTIGPWTEHTASDGKKYYYHNVTKQSTYEKPDAFKSAAERALPVSEWKEYIKAGKSYFFNSVSKQSVWEEPMEFTQYRARLEAMCAGDVPTKDAASMEVFNAAQKALSDSVVDSDGTGAERKLEQQKRLEAAAKEKKRVKSAEELELKVVSSDLKAPTAKKAPQFESDEAATEAFKQLLSDKKVPADATWLEAMGYGIANDKRFKALKSLKKKKQALQDYVQWKKTKDEEVLKEKLAETETNFKTLLQEMVESKKINGRTRLADAMDALESDKRFTDFSDDLTREKMLQTFLDDLYNKEKKKLAEQRRVLFAAGSEALADLVKAEKVDPRIGWGDVTAAALKDADDPRLVAIERVDLPMLWKEFASEFREKERRRRAEEERLNKQRRANAQRDLYTWLLNGFKKGELSIAVPFATTEGVTGAEVLLRDQEHMKVLLGMNDRIAAQDEYEAAVRKMEKEAESCRKSLKKTLKRAKVKLEDGEKWEVVVSKYGETKYTDKEGQSLVLMDKLTKLEKEFTVPFLEAALVLIHADYRKRFERKKSDFEDLLWDIIYKSEHVGMTWEMAQAKISKEEEFLALPNDEVRQEIFKEYMQKFNARKEKKRLAAKMKEAKVVAVGPSEDGEITDDADESKGKRKRSHSRSSSSDGSRKHSKKSKKSKKKHKKKSKHSK